MLPEIHPEREEPCGDDRGVADPCALSASRFEGPEDLRRLGLQGLGEHQQRANRRKVLPPLEEADVLTADAARERERLLRQPTASTQFAEHDPEVGGGIDAVVCGAGHTGTLLC